MSLTKNENWEVVFQGAMAAFLAGLSSLVFGQTLLFGELIKPITLFYQEHASINYPSNVTENAVIEVGFNKISMNLSFGLLLLSINYFLKGWFEPSMEKLNTMSQTDRLTMLDQAKHKRETTIFTFVVIGFTMWTLGYLLVGWLRPSFGTFLGLSIGLISSGGGFVVWGSIILFAERISVVRDSNTWQNRIMLGLFASGPPIYMILFFPTLQNIVYDHASESFSGLGTSSGEYPFYLVYQTVGTLALPLLAVLIGLLGLEFSVTRCGCRTMVSKTKSAIRNIPTSIANTSRTIGSNITNKQKRKEITWQLWMFIQTKAMLFIASRALYSIVFFGSIMMFSNYVMHGDKTLLHSFDINHKVMGFTNELEENHVVRVCVLLMATGVLVGRLLYSILVTLPQSQTSHTPIEEGLFVRNITAWQKRSVFFIGWLALLASSAVMWGWFVRASNVDDMSYTSDIYALAFFIGFSNGVVFLDSILTVLFYFNTPNITSKGDLSNMSYARTRQPDTYFLILVLLMLPGIISARFSSGMFGNIAPNGVHVIDYPYFVMILAILATISLALQTILFIIECVNSDQEAQQQGGDLGTSIKQELVQGGESLLELVGADPRKLRRIKRGSEQQRLNQEEEEEEIKE